MVDHARRIFRFLAACLSAGEGAALVTVVSVTGASVRNPGAHMAVSADGRSVGSLSGGCIEVAVVAEAREAIAEGCPRLLHYGAGSPIIDIRLPCGGAVHLLVSPIDDIARCHGVLAAFARREEASLRLERPGGGRIEVIHAPPLRIAVFGLGATTGALARLAQSMGADISVWSPDKAVCDEFRPDATWLRTPEQRLAWRGDRWTAAALLFHDHDWEAPLLRQLLAEPALVIGAMGSRATHAARMERLAALGVAAEDLGRIRSPIGLIHSSRDPDTLALSAFVEAVEAYNRTEPSRVT